jgi:hypothetical protein
MTTSSYFTNVRHFWEVITVFNYILKYCWKYSSVSVILWVDGWKQIQITVLVFLGKKFFFFIDLLFLFRFVICTVFFFFLWLRPACGCTWRRLFQKSVMHTKLEGLWLWCLTPLPTKFQLNRGGAFYWWGKSLTNFIT